MSSTPAIDPSAIENLRALSPDDHDEFLREIVGIFLDDTPKRIAELDHSLAADDNATFSRAAHSIKGSSSNLGANALRAVAEKLEQQSRSGLTDVAPLIATVKTEFARAQAELNKLIGK